MVNHANFTLPLLSLTSLHDRRQLSQLVALNQSQQDCRHSNLRRVYTAGRGSSEPQVQGAPTSPLLLPASSPHSCPRCCFRSLRYHYHFSEEGCFGMRFFGKEKKENRRYQQDRSFKGIESTQKRYRTQQYKSSTGIQAIPGRLSQVSGQGFLEPITELGTWRFLYGKRHISSTSSWEEITRKSCLLCVNTHCGRTVYITSEMM
nr:uncharacterized protein LOC105882550 isoform X2 [Microcebus murinus]